MSIVDTSASGPIFFFREYEQPYGFLSQWYECSFTAPSPNQAVDPMVFRTTEQYMMYHKAILFHDEDIAKEIMAATTPKKQKALGRKVRGFDGAIWNANRERIVEEGNWNKFSNSKEELQLKQLLLNTDQRELVEVKIWGIGYSASNALLNRSNWGENLLGKALTRVRERLRTHT
ncbi:MAG: hypothetical protein Q9190_002190 [Brigantiaea leucoxantha]